MARNSILKPSNEEGDLQAGRITSKSAARRELILPGAGSNRPGLRVIVQALPPWAGFAGARRPGVSPDQAGFMQLVKACGCRYKGDRVGVVIQPLPPWAGVAGARRTAVAPDPAILVQLEQLVSARHDRGGVRVVIQALPP